MKHTHRNCKSDSGSPILSFALCLLFSNTLAEAGTVAQTPLFLTTTVKPNVLLMVDNSGSMKTDVTISAEGTAYDSTIH